MLFFLESNSSTTPSYSVNGGTEIHGVTSDWQRQPLRRNIDGTIDYLPSALNLWRVPEMIETEFETLRGLQGCALTSLETNNFDDRNSAKTYTVNAILESVVNGNQLGRLMTNVRLSFRVDV